MQAEDRPYKNGYHLYHLAFIQQLRKNQFNLQQACGLFKLDNPFLHLREELRDTFH